MGPLWGVPLSSVCIFSLVPSHLCFARMFSFLGRCRSRRIGAPPPGSWSRRRRLSLVVPVPLQLSGASLPPCGSPSLISLFFSYGRAFRLPASFPISGLAGLRVGPGLCGLSWRVFASTCPLMLPSTCSGEALLACPPFSAWSLPFFAVGSALSAPCSRSGPPSRRGAAVARLGSLLPRGLVL